MKRFIIITLLAAGAVAAAYAWPESTASASAGDVADVNLFTVSRGDLNIVLAENGELVAKNSQNIVNTANSWAEIKWLIDEGTEVVEGDELARLDTKELDERVERLELDIVQAETDLMQATTDHEIQVVDNDAKLERAGEALTKARKEREKYEKGDAINEERKLRVAIQDANTRYTRAKKKYEDSQTLFEETYINKSQLEEDEIEFAKAEAQREGALLDLEIFEEYSKPLALADKNRAVTDAEREQETTGKRNESSLRQRQTSLDKAKTKLDKLRDSLVETQEELEKMVLAAPCPGYVIYGDPKNPWNRDDIKVGGRTWSGQTMLTIPDLRVMQVKLSVHEADVNKLSEGNPATVTMDTYPGLAISGTVTKIASIAGSDDSWRRGSDVKTFAVEVTLEASAEVELKPGVSAKAEIFIDRRDDVLFVPLQTVFSEEGKHFCYVLGAKGTPVRRSVEPGQGNDHYLEIISGLEIGDQVLLYNPNLPGGGTGPSDAAEESDGDDDAPGEATAADDDSATVMP